MRFDITLEQGTHTNTIYVRIVVGVTELFLTKEEAQRLCDEIQDRLREG